MNIRGPLSSLFSLNALVWLAMLTGFAALLCLAAAAWFAMAPPLGAIGRPGDPASFMLGRKPQPDT
ncbi:MAG: hypothetical protein ACPG75_06835, partial [Alloalcanivorax venustensis]